ncbi:RagB/SusD family nutrient uptake outer membrane protein [Sphingobacterium spiritivorum]|uniref:RagB/SusD family nutrient uptake outer membrane protein n=1 Tax=Sphingobacterium spiritivorum TaxID=258 RepID=UPI003DA51DB7
MLLIALHDLPLEHVGQRWFDLVTLGIADNEINAINELGRKFVSGRQELFPIPKSEIDLNSNLQQNPGYEQ